jgi:hypothetical protein
MALHKMPIKPLLRLLWGEDFSMCLYSMINFVVRQNDKNFPIKAIPVISCAGKR